MKRRRSSLTELKMTFGAERARRDCQTKHGWPHGSTGERLVAALIIFLAVAHTAWPHPEAMKITPRSSALSPSGIRGDPAERGVGERLTEISQAAFAVSYVPLRVIAQNAEDPDARAQARLAWMREHQRGMWNVAPSEGAFLREQVIKVKAQHALEIGTSNGYSAIWTATGLRRTGGHLLTLEIDEGRARLAAENFKAAGVDSLVKLRLGDALEEVPRLKGPFEFVFIDADKSDYVRYLRMVEPMVPPGGVIVAHNVSDLRSLLEDFIQAVETDPQLKTTFENPGPGGFSVSVKLPGR